MTPAVMVPMGINPNTSIRMAITRPRISGGVMYCTIAMLIVMNPVCPNPTITRRPRERSNADDWEKPAMARPAPTPNSIMMPVLGRSLLNMASSNDEQTAPTPVAVNNRPRPDAPTPRTSRWKIGISEK